MKITRLSAAQLQRFALTTILAFSAFAAQSAPGNKEPNATVINFSSKDNLDANAALDVLTKRLDLRNGTDEFRSAFLEQPGDGLQVQRFNQYFKGLRVSHGSYAVASKDGKLSYAFGKFFRLDAATSTAPLISEADALAKALAATGAGKYQWDLDKSLGMPKGNLEFVEDFSWGEPDGTPHLAYVFDIYAAEPLSREYVYVDAATGKILLRDAIIKHVSAQGKSLYSDTVSLEVTAVTGGFRLQDATRGNGINTYDFKGNTYGGGGTPSIQPTYQVISATTFFTADPAVDAHWGASKVYDYWKNTHNRNSWNGNNGVLNSFVNYGSAYDNAFWNGAAMFYGNGSGVQNGGLSPLTSLDVCGHEIGHGVCQSTAGLVYQGESGGMNEGFSDIWGAVIENYGDPKERDARAKDMWLIGEELGNTFRSMRDPKAYRQPDTYLGQNWIYTGSGCDASNDKCGVHTNSGVLNHWFFLLTDGGKGVNDLGNAYQVSGLGVLSAAKIAYATELSLTSNSNYAACRVASINAATTIFGACSKEVESVVRAWHAVGVGTAFTACAPQVSFTANQLSADENAATNSCTASRVYNLPVVLNGPAPTGGNAVVTLVPIGGTAVAGVDYTLPTNTLTFNAGSTASQAFNINITDDGSLGTDKYVDFALTMSANGSNLALADVLDTVRVTISSDDRAPIGKLSMNFSVGQSSSTNANASSPFLSGYANGRGQYIYSATELAASGLRPGMPITAISFTIAQKYSTQPFSGYTVKMGHTTDINFSSPAFLTPSMTTVYNGNYTTSIGINQIALATPFIWDGTSNVLIEVCFSNTTQGAGNDRVLASANGSAAATAFSNVVSGCGLSLNGANISYYRPLIRFSQDITPTSIAQKVGDTRSWNIRKNQTSYFYTEPGKEIIAGVLAPDTNLGCITAKITVAGNGFVDASGGKKRSVKEYEISSTQSVAGTTFDVILYFTDEELAGVDPYSIHLVQTSSVNDTQLIPSNTKVVYASDVIYGVSWTGFRATFNDLGRFYLSTGPLALSASTVKAARQELWTGANPFSVSPVLHWDLSKSEPVNITVTDVTGKLVYNQEMTLNAGVNKATLSLNAGLPAGTYILKVVRPTSVFTRQMVKY